MFIDVTEFPLSRNDMNSTIITFDKCGFLIDVSYIVTPVCHTGYGRPMC